jgi:UDP-glucose 4-epimerase
MSKGRATVTGGSGFLGSHVVDALCAAGYRVSIFDHKDSSHRTPEQEMIIGDILDAEQVSDAIAGSDLVYHFAGMADIHMTNERPIDAVKCNILGTANILEACVKANVSRFVFASSVYVYSDQGGVYRTTKQASELLIENYAKLFGLDFTILRFGSLYGRRSDPSNSIYSIIHQALTEGRIQRKGDGEEIRDYIHVDDAARASVEILDMAFQNDYVILTGSQTIKAKDLLRMIREMFNNQVDIEYLDDRIEEHYEITPYVFRPRVAKKYIQNTQLDLGQGILDTIYEVAKELDGSKEKGAVISLPD